LDLTSPLTFWLLRNGIGEVPLPLSRDRRCDVAVIGAGITGALVSDALSEAGLSVIAVDRRYPGHGSTSAPPSFLQYEFDASPTDLPGNSGVNMRSMLIAPRSAECGRSPGLRAG